MLYEASGDDAWSQMMTCRGFRHFKNGRTSVDDEQCGRPSTSRSEALIAQMKNIIHGNRRLSV
jgi:hypothetical protein